MATILLAAAGSAIGGSALGFLGTIGSVSIGAALGQAAGAALGAVVDSAVINALFPPPKQQGPRLSGTQIQDSTEGSPGSQAYGRSRMVGKIIWATRFEESSTDVGGGKSGAPVVTEYSYFGNFAIAICDGVIGANKDGVSEINPYTGVDGVCRIWADGAEIDRSKYTIRVYPGDELQTIDPLIEAKEGVNNAPAFRGIAYAVFEHFPLENWGNRIPQFGFEVFRPVGAVEGKITGPGVVVDVGIEGIAVIGGGEFGLDTTEVTKSTSDGNVSENRHTLVAASDFKASLDAFDRVSVGHHSVALLVPWFGSDLRAGNCAIKPKVETSSKSTSPYSWAVSGQGRSGAGVVSDPTLRPTPADLAVIRAIRGVWAQDKAVVLCPTIVMDIAPGNSLPNPYSNGAGTNGQPAYPWRGLITCSPAAGFTGSVDKSSTAATQVAGFMGSAATTDFGNSGDTITYSGPSEWSYRRFILHYAKLIRQARDGATIVGPATLFIGGGLTGLERVRSDATTYPFVTALKTLLADCRTILGAETNIVSNAHPPPSTVDIGIKLGYAADWTSWNNHRPDDGSGDVLFNLDPLWSDSHLNFIGIDAFFPLSDWRDGASHLDFNAAGPISPYDQTYLRANVRGGEYFDWIYASDADRASQTRTTIADSDPANEPWVFRQKDIRGWWLNAHHDRPGGVRSGSATDWTAKGKTILFTTYGCPAVDKGANLPHAGMPGREPLPAYSSGGRDDGMQRAWLEAFVSQYRNVGSGDTSFVNPYSSITQNFMVDLGFSHAYAWDARPWPSYPLDATWTDASAWFTGHWLSGRLGRAPARETLAAILDDSDFTDYTIADLSAVVDGVSNSSITSARAIIESLQAVYRFDAVESQDKIKFQARDGRPSIATLTIDDLVIDDGQSEPGDRFKMTRAQEIDLPDAVLVNYGDSARDDQAGEQTARRSTGTSQRVVTITAPVVMDEVQARDIAETELHAAWIGRERGTLSLPPSIGFKMDPGDVVLTEFGPVPYRMKASQATFGEKVDLEVFQVPAANYAPPSAARSGGKVTPNPATLPATVVLIDGPLMNDADKDYAGYIAGVKAPFGSGIAAYRSPTTTGYVLDTILAAASGIGVTTADFSSGLVGLWDRANTLSVQLQRGSLASVDELQVLNGANVILLQNQDGEWEVVQFQTAAPTGTRAYDLTTLLRGQKGTEHAMRDPVPAGARIVVFDTSVVQTNLSTEMVGLLLNWKAGPAELGIGADGFVDFTQAMTAKARRPLSPVQLSGMRDAGTGDWALNWIRRTRIGGDSWDQVEVPLGEDSESYQIDILDGSTVKRTETVSAPAFTYTAAMQTTDFGSTQSTLTIRVAQISASYGAGIATTSDIIETRRAA